MSRGSVSLRIFLSLCLLLIAVEAAQWRPARRGYSWSFPQHHWAQDGYRTEWWYFTGRLVSESDPERIFGYQFTFFRVGLLPQRPQLESQWAASDLVMGHAAVTDLAAKKHSFSEVLYRAIPMLGGFSRYPDPLIAWSRAPTGTDGRWTLSWNGKAFDFSMEDRAQELAFDLTTLPRKGLVFQGPNGFSRKGSGKTAASHYYSFTRLQTEGTVKVRGQTFKVRGESWMDKEFGSNQLSADQVGWDWLSLQLNDGREVMLYLLRDDQGRVDFARGSLVSSTGEVRYLAAGEWSVHSSGIWKSRETDAEYPAGWTVKLPDAGLKMVVLPELADQENRSRIVEDLFYWEGLVRVQDLEGRKIGHGYVELTGYGTGRRPAI